MIVHVFDVEHGECIVVESPNGSTILIGAGHNASTNWRPSQWFAQRGVAPTAVVLSNLDSDHFTDLSNFEPAIRPAYIFQNRSINPAQALAIKQQNGVSAGIATALHWSANVFTGAPVTVDFGITMQTFWHSVGTFPADDFNNLSVVTYVEYAGVGIMLPSDLERGGWQAFLSNPAFVLALSKTKVLVASHHGRENGYYPGIFNFCRPDLVIISDKNIMHETQRHDLYTPHVIGLTDRDGTTRRILTTRSDGKITVTVSPTGQYLVNYGGAY